MNEEWVLDLLRVAYKVAAISPDQSNQNGAVVVAQNGNMVADCNRFPHELKDTDEILADRDRKMRYIEHSERTAIFGACRAGLSTDGGTMVCPWAPCMECARAIIFAGITTLIVHGPRMATTPERWRANVDEALAYVKACGVDVVSYDGPIGGPAIKVNGEDWQP